MGLALEMDDCLVVPLVALMAAYLAVKKVGLLDNLMAEKMADHWVGLKVHQLAVQKVYMLAELMAKLTVARRVVQWAYHLVV